MGPEKEGEVIEIDKDGLPKFEAGARMPSFHSMDTAEGLRRIQAEASNARFLEALGRYFDNGGRA